MCASVSVYKACFLCSEPLQSQNAEGTPAAASRSLSLEFTVQQAGQQSYTQHVQSQELACFVEGGSTEEAASERPRFRLGLSPRTLAFQSAAVLKKGEKMHLDGFLYSIHNLKSTF